MDIFGDDIDSIAGTNPLNANIKDDDDGDVQIIGDNDDGQRNADDDQQDDAAAAAGGGSDNEHGPIKVEAKKRIVRNPQFVLNVERLKSNRGIHTLEDYYKDIRFAGKGHECQDLDNVMKRMEHWAHRLYPKYNFADFLSVTEKLGKKKEMQTHMYRYRQGLLEPVMNLMDGDDAAGAALSDDENIEVARASEPIDEFDDLIGQQIEKYRTAAPPKTPGPDTTFNTLRAQSIMGTPTFMERRPVEASTPRSPPLAAPLPAATSLTAEQMAKIAENRRAAQERLRAKREAAAAAAAAPSASESQTNTQQDDDLMTGISFL